MTNSRSRKSVVIYTVLLILTVAVTYAVGYILTDAGDRTNKFYLALYALFLAETVTFLYPVVMTVWSGKVGLSLPFHFGTGMIIAAYDVGVAGLTLIAFTGISVDMLLALHLVWLLFFVVSVGVAAVGGMLVGGIDARAKEQRAPLVALGNQFTGICDRLAVMDTEACKALSGVLAGLREDFTYATAESLPGSENVDRELAACIGQMEGKVAELEQSAGLGDETTGKLANDINGLVQRAGMILKRREDIMRRLR